MQRTYFFACALSFISIFSAFSAVAQGKANESSSQQCSPSNLFIGPSTIFEDAANHFNTYGADVAYTHPLSKGIGITGDAGIHVGSSMGFNYTKYQVLIGVSLLLVDQRKISFFPHLLAGISDVNSKFNIATTSSSTNSVGFSMAAGTNISFPINKNIALVGRIDYNPTIGTGGVSNNFRVGVGVNINLGCNEVSSPGNDQNNNTTQEKVKCKASKDTKELKIGFVAVEKGCKSVEEYANKIPRVEAKITIKPQLTVKQGEECCSEDKLPVQYTELKGGVEGKIEVKITLWGIPDINYTVQLWAALLKAEFKLKLTLGPEFKFTVDGVGKFYGELGNTIDPGPDCRSCWYLNLKTEGSIKLGINAGGSIALYHWSPFADSPDGFDIDKGADEKIEASAEASVSVGVIFNGTYRSAKECIKPPEGVHGTFTFGKAKANLKFNLTLGPLTFDPSFEVNIFDGWDATF